MKPAKTDNSAYLVYDGVVVARVSRFLSAGGEGGGASVLGVGHHPQVGVVSSVVHHYPDIHETFTSTELSRVLVAPRYLREADKNRNVPVLSGTLVSTGS